MKKFISSSCRNIKKNFERRAGDILRIVSAGNLVTLNGQEFSVPSKMDGINIFSLWRGKYERHELEVLRTHFLSDHTILELGAHIGVVARAAIEHKILSNGRYIVVEPNPSSLMPLRENLAGSCTTPGTHYFICTDAVGVPKAEGDAASFIAFNNLSSGLAEYKTRQNNNGVRLKIPVYSLNYFMDKFAPYGASLICDIEGGEYDIVFKTPEAFAKVRQILIELHKPLAGRTEKQQDIIGKFEEMGFALVARRKNVYCFRRPNFDELIYEGLEAKIPAAAIN